MLPTPVAIASCLNSTGTRSNSASASPTRAPASLPPSSPKPAARRLPLNWSPTKLAVVYDDLTMPVGRLKLSASGSAGGHNGVQSLIDHLGAGFIRYRIGIGPRTPPQIDLKDFVLGRFPPADQQTIDLQISNYLNGLELLATRGLEPAMNQLNRRISSANDTDQAQV